jgi:hypothetical protein
MTANVGGFIDERRGVGALYSNATLRPNVKTEDVEALIYAEIDRLKEEPIADWELNKAKNTTRPKLHQRFAEFDFQGYHAWSVHRLLQRAWSNQCQTGQGCRSDEEDVQRVAKKYLGTPIAPLSSQCPKPKPRAQTLIRAVRSKR